MRDDQRAAAVTVARADLAWALKFMAVDGEHTRDVKARLTAALKAVFVECPCCDGNGSEWPTTRGYECVMCAGADAIDEKRLPGWDHILSSAG